MTEKSTIIVYLPGLRGSYTTFTEGEHSPYLGEEVISLKANSESVMVKGKTVTKVFVNMVYELTITKITEDNGNN